MLTEEIIRVSTKKPKTNSLILKRSYKLARLEVNKYMKSALDHGAQFVASHMLFRFPNGSEIHFGFIESKHDPNKYFGSHFEYIDTDSLDKDAAVQIMAHCHRPRKAD